MIPLITLVLILSSLILTLIWHNTQINRKCSGPKCFRLCGSNILFEIELENGVTACGDTGGRGATGSNAGVGGQRGCLADTRTTGSSESDTHPVVLLAAYLLFLLLTKARSLV